MTLWPSGLRRYVKAVVFTGVGSNPIEVIFCNFILYRSDCTNSSADYDVIGFLRFEVGSIYIYTCCGK
jgi:hypothetical protein